MTVLITSSIDLSVAAFALLIALPAAVALILLGAAAQKIKQSVLGKLRYSRVFSKNEAAEGSEVYIIETVYNPTPIPILFVNIASFIDGGLEIDGHSSEEGMQTLVSRFHLLPFAKTTRRHRATCLKRGLYTMKSAAVMSKKGLLEYNDSFVFDEKLYVFPKSVSCPPAGAAMNPAKGGSVSRNVWLKDPFSASGVRDLAPRDPFNLINFKATAKAACEGRGKIKVNVLDPASERTVVVLLNFKEPEDEAGRRSYERKMERALSIASYLIKEAASDGNKFALFANCEAEDGSNALRFPVSCGRRHATSILRALAAARISFASSFSALAEAGMRCGISRADIFVIGAAADENQARAVSIMRRSNSVEVIRV